MAIDKYEYEYEYEVQYPNHDRHYGKIFHNYNDGALVLIRKVLEKIEKGE